MVVFLLIAMLLVPIMFTGSWGGMMGPGMMGFGGMGFSWIRMLIGILVTLLFVGLIIFGIYYIFSGRTISEPEKRSPLNIIKERYARGEITKKEYDQMKRELAKGD